MKDLLCFTKLGDYDHVSYFSLDKTTDKKNTEWLNDIAASIVCELMMEHSQNAVIAMIEKSLFAQFSLKLVFCDLEVGHEATFSQCETYRMAVCADLAKAERPSRPEHIGTYILVPIHAIIYQPAEGYEDLELEDPFFPDPERVSILLEMNYSANIPVKPYIKGCKTMLEHFNLQHTYDVNAVPRPKSAANACEAMAMDTD